MEEFFHIHRREADQPTFFEQGMKSRTCESGNRFWNLIATEYRYFCPNGKVQYGPVKYSRKMAEKQTFQMDELKFLADSLNESGMFLREMVFEEIRREKYPEKPSRRNSMWLTEEDAIGIWSLFLKGRVELGATKFELDLVKLRCSGIFHKGNQHFLNNEIDSYNNFASAADRYWRGDFVEDGNDNEILFSGEFEVLKVERNFC